MMEEEVHDGRREDESDEMLLQRMDVTRRLL
jgi:hypothetical protein